jgi:hypothetical protein
MDNPFPDNPLAFNAAPLQADNLPTFKKRAGMFGSDSPLRGIAGAIGDYLLQRAGAQPIYSPMAQRRQMQQQEEDQYQRHLKDTMSTWIAQQAWKQAHPDPVNNDTENDYNYILKTLGKDAADQFLRTKTNPIVMTPMGPMPYSAVNPPAAKPLTDDDILKMGGQSGAGPTGGFRY